ncbi:hypothetical protein [Pectinatus frisingensis]|uniref:hypothetical protein n=1 Tax=Pectinatus frisingensis TaxID=865 RepID=UPI0018C76F2F|nr:hypothetical protein [Pectinatus frisingensis]
MNSDEKLQKKIVYYENKQKKEETYIATHTENLEKIKDIIIELNKKKDMAIIKKILTITREKGLDINNVINELTENNGTDKKINVEQNNTTEDSKEKQPEEKYEKFVPHVPDVFK